MTGFGAKCDGQDWTLDRDWVLEWYVKVDFLANGSRVQVSIEAPSDTPDDHTADDPVVALGSDLPVVGATAFEVSPALPQLRTDPVVPAVQAKASQRHRPFRPS